MYLAGSEMNEDGTDGVASIEEAKSWQREAAQKETIVILW